MANLAPMIRQRFFDASAEPLNGGKLFTYEAGTTTNKVTYSDSAGTSANTNPVILDSEGYADVWLSTGSYKFVLKDSLDNTLWTKDNISNATVENGFSTGDVKITLKSSADSGWIMADDKTIGNSSSGATGRANDDTESLYELIWNNVLDAWAPVTGGRGASASSDFAANKPLKLPRTLGRALAFAGAGDTLTSRALGSYIGAENHTLSSGEMPSHTHTQDALAHNYYARAMGSADHFHGDSGSGQFGSMTSGAEASGVAFTVNGDLIVLANTATNQNTGGGGAHNNMQPTTFFNIMIKL